MAPRRGGGGSSSSGSVNTCPGAFPTTYDQAYFANDVVFFAVFLGIAVALCSFRKKSVAGKGLLGLPFIGLILFNLVSLACSIISTVLRECDQVEYEAQMNWNISISIFTCITYWLFLVVVVYQLNTMLLKQLERSNAIFKIVPAVFTGFMGLLTIALLALRAYIYSAQKDLLLNRARNRVDYVKVIEAHQKFSAAYWALYFVTVIASGALALMTILSLRKARKAGGDLIGWSVALTVAMMLWVIIYIVFAAWNLQLTDYTIETQIALSYITNFGQALSCIFVLCIAKHASWRKPANAAQYDPNAQQHYYHQAPEFVGNTYKP